MCGLTCDGGELSRTECTIWWIDHGYDHDECCGRNTRLYFHGGWEVGVGGQARRPWRRRWLVTHGMVRFGRNFDRFDDDAAADDDGSVFDRRAIVR